MAFVTKEWKDRLAEFAGRRRLINVSTGEETVVDVTRNEGSVSQEGDAFSAANMNNLEQRIKDEFDEVNSNIADLGKSVADGKTAVAAAISAKGVNTAADATFDTMAANIKNIKTASKITSALIQCSSHTQTEGYFTVKNGYILNANLIIAPLQIKSTTRSDITVTFNISQSGTTITVQTSGSSYVYCDSIMAYYLSN